MSEQYANDPGATLSGSITSSSSSFTLSSATGYPGSGTFRVRIDSEIIIVGSISGTTCGTLTRGAEGTTAASHSSGVAVGLVLTVASLQRLPGFLLGASNVPALEATSSTSFGPLTTADSVTFNLSLAASVLVEADTFVTFTVSSTDAPSLAIVVDSSVDTPSINQVFIGAAGVGSQLNFGTSGIYSLAAGSHTIALNYKTNAGSAAFQNRKLKVTLVG